MEYVVNSQTIVYLVLGAAYLGVVVVFAILLVLLAGCFIALSNAWRNYWQDFRLNLYVYMALRAYQRAGHQRPDNAPMVDEERKLLGMAHYLIDSARDAGFVVTIATEPMQPLRMGNYCMEADVRPARKP